MARIMAIDYGGKRTGLAVTDPLQIIASALETVETKNLLDYLKNYCEKEDVEAFVLGKPLSLDGSETHASPLVHSFAEELKKKFPGKPIHYVDERYTSKMAVQSMIASGVKKKDRRKKGNIDKVAATIILQEFMDEQH
ncbi:Holliday junction resolvase RuvX [Marinilongibacter aquaticus]|uniref:Holliday junction resolvase RuvX n=1 Tax=Marinilongibacter aquaticus TaxID=2975157 RepID=UPI0021BCFC1F|nr:Holliday junction resolvase RuvX [Marinilongibacter aquaticus]UBM57613.1 Holliday junction resolvase RuvX [Marinilongibacter aquaticus]